MYEIKERLKEKVVLVTVALPEDEKRGWGADDSAKELRKLATSSGANVVDEIRCKRDKLTPNYLVGKGKLEEVRALIDAYDGEIDAVLFSRNLSPTQGRNLKEVLKIKVVDRTQLILDVFAQRAHTNEGKLQVELAQLEYALPRLSGLGIKLSRLGGGIGTRGPGEQMLETDRRGIMRKIKYIKTDLTSLEKRRSQLRRNRSEHSLATVAIVGYTNAGKSTLLNQLTGSSVDADNKLFCTLDAVSRRYSLPNNQKLLFIDTVGFIHDIPHGLIEAFKATLEEVKEADLLLHVIDISSAKADEHLKAVYSVLKELDAYDKPIITALNKVDLLDNKYTIERFRRNIGDCVAISALKETGFGGLSDIISKKLKSLVRTVDLVVPYNKLGLLNKIYQEGKVIERNDSPEGVRIKAIIPTKMTLNI
ncbi:GTPase HflX [Candidatus Omnitrophota bacterium]